MDAAMDVFTACPVLVHPFRTALWVGWVVIIIEEKTGMFITILEKIVYGL
jgi:hypothetical protein